MMSIASCGRPCPLDWVNVSISWSRRILATGTRRPSASAAGRCWGTGRSAGTNRTQLCTNSTSAAAIAASQSHARDLIALLLEDRRNAGLHHLRQPCCIPVGQSNAAMAFGTADRARLARAVDAVLRLGY